MSEPEDNVEPELSENDKKYEEAYSEFMTRREAIWNPRFQEAEEFHRECKERAAKRKKEANDPQLQAKKEKEAKEAEREFDEKQQAYLTAMEQFIPLPESYFHSDLEGGRTGIQVHRNDDSSVASRTSGVDEAVPTTTRQLTRQSRLTESNVEALETLDPIPIRRYSYQAFKVESEASASPPPSIRTGTQIRVNRVPTERIPPSEGLTEYGLHPHATAWTRAPLWAQVSVAAGMGAALGGLGYGIIKLVSKFVNRNRVGRRLHARDWQRQMLDLE